jgi:hypothetical protein
MPVAIQVPNPQSGTFTATVVDNNGNPSTVLDANQEFKINCEWELDTPLSQMLEGTFEISTYAEAIGAGVEKRIGFLSVPIVLNQKNYGPVDVVVAADTLPDQTTLLADESGTYKLVTLLTHRNSGGTVSDIVALEDGATARIT